jgi:hypothetical protein
LIFATKTSTNQKKPIPQWARSKFQWISSSHNPLISHFKRKWITNRNM